MRPILVPLVLSLLLGTSSCEKDDDTVTSSGVKIDFRTDSGYTFANDTIPQGDTLRVGVTITAGEDPLDWFYLSVAYDSTDGTSLDTVLVDTNPFVYETVHVTRDQAGTEQLIFSVFEHDGDRTTSRLTFVVP